MNKKSIVFVAVLLFAVFFLGMILVSSLDSSSPSGLQNFVAPPVEGNNSTLGETDVEQNTDETLDEMSDTPTDEDSIDISEESGYVNETVSDEPPVLSEFAEGKLEVLSLFQFSGINPDKNLEECTDVFSVQVRNVSDEYLIRADFTVTLTNGSSTTFVVTDIPSGRSVLAFSTENALLEQNQVIDFVQGTAVFEDQDLILCEEVESSVDGISVTLKNLTDKDLQNVMVCCRSPYGENYFGGSSYWYTVDLIPANDVSVVEAWDCILGDAEVIRIIVK